ncbi:hypothetical protein JCM16303_001120 [Sporobolomyces ruberrimus]
MHGRLRGSGTHTEERLSRQQTLDGPGASLFGRQLILVGGAKSARRLHAIFEIYPELGRSVRNISFSFPIFDWSQRKLIDIFRKAAGLLRLTPVVKELSLLHVALSDKTRKRFFGALSALKPEVASITCIGEGGGAQGGSTFSPNSDDMRALAQLLFDWPSLKSLTLRG